MDHVEGEGSGAGSVRSRPPFSAKSSPKLTKALKSTYTFKLVKGDQFKFEIEVFYYNFGTKELEPLSSSPQTTPRDRKISLGFLNSVKCVDTKYLCVDNSRGDTALLEFDRLSPLLDDKDSKLKQTLINFKDQGCEKIVEIISKLLEQFHSAENSVTQDDDSSGNCLSDLVRRCSSLTLSKTPTEASGSGVCSSEMDKGQSVSLLTKTFDKSSSQPSAPDPKRRKLDTVTEDASSVNDDSNEDDDYAEEQVEINKLIEEAIRKAEFVAVKFDKIEIPKCLSIDSVKVSQLKEYLKSTPDKTQVFVGLVRTVDSEGYEIGNYECWVNPEMFLAQMQLQMETEGYANRVLSVVHTVYEDSVIDKKVLGSFLSANSKDFSVKFKDRLTYQELLLFAFRVLEEDNSETTRKFVRSSIRGFSKGKKYSGIFIEFASLPPHYLKEFEKFCRLYEEGSLHGMKLSARKRCGMNKKNEAKLEVPIELIKTHLKVTQKARENLLEKILKAEIALPDYRSWLMKLADLSEVKSNISKISGQSFQDLKAKYGKNLDDGTLSEFVGAKTLPSGPNGQFSKLSKYVNDLLAVAIDDEESINPLDGSVTFTKAENMNILTIGRKVKDASVVVIQSGVSRDLYNKFEYSTKENVLGKSCIGVFVVGESMFTDISYNFNENQEIIVERIFFKSDHPKIVNGVKKEIIPIVLAAHKNLISDKGISNFYSQNLKECLPSILHCLVGVKGNVLSIFSDKEEAIDLDPNGVLMRRGVSINYVAQHDAMEVLELKIKKKAN